MRCAIAAARLHLRRGAAAAALLGRADGAAAHIVRATSTWRVASIIASHEPSASKHARGDKGEAASRGSELTAWAELVVLDGAGRFVEAAWAQSKWTAVRADTLCRASSAR